MGQISDACGSGDAGRALVPGSLRGYRTWRVVGPRAHRPDSTLPLSSVTRRSVVWSPTLTARCEPHDTAAPGPFSAIDGDHRAPHAGCSCGIYGWYSPTDTDMVSARVFGVIEASGLILMGDRGFRAESAKITAVVTRNRRVAALCARSGITVYRRRRDLLRDHPPEDMSSLLGDLTAPVPRDALPPMPPPPFGFGGLLLLVVWARAALVTSALVAFPTSPAVATAVVAHLVVIGLIVAHLRH